MCLVKSVDFDVGIHAQTKNAVFFSGGFRLSGGAQAGPRLSGWARAEPIRAHMGPIWAYMGPCGPLWAQVM